VKDADDVLRDMVDKGEGRIGIREVLQCIMGQFGGPLGFSEKLFLDFEASKPGSANRIRIESDILRALQAFGEPDDDDDDIGALAAEAKQLMQEAQGDDADA